MTLKMAIGSILCFFFRLDYLQTTFMESGVTLPSMEPNEHQMSRRVFFIKCMSLIENLSVFSGSCRKNRL